MPVRAYPGVLTAAQTIVVVVCVIAVPSVDGRVARYPAA